MNLHLLQKLAIETDLKAGELELFGIYYAFSLHTKNITISCCARGKIHLYLNAVSEQ